MFHKIMAFVSMLLPALGFILFPLLSRADAGGEIVLKGEPVIYTSAKPGEPLYRAITALQRDMKKVLGKAAIVMPLSAISETGIVVTDSRTDRLVKTVVTREAHHLYVGTIRGKRQIILEGADMRGAIYAVYAFSEKVLGVPPLWYYSEWLPTAKKEIKVSLSFNIMYSSPAVKYRAWFPNDTDLFAPWRKLSPENNEIWLETALRLKLNTIEWFDAERDYAARYTVSPTTKLISDYGLINTTHHHSPLNASLEGWADYWKKTRDTVPPELLLANEKQLEEFWRYNVECIVRNKIDMLWVVGFRAQGDHPFWFTFKDAPASMKDRGEVISRMMEKQRAIALEVIGKPDVQFRTIFYDELSDLLAQGYIHPPADTSFIRTYVAARRDHFPNTDIRLVPSGSDLNLGYYFNYQFTSTGSHLAAGEGPWKMEENFRYVASKSRKPLAFSVVNAGNIREFVVELSANAAMMWNFDKYATDQFLRSYCSLYFGSAHADKAARLYKAYYNAYWRQKNPDMQGFDRQYIFQDLRYKKAIQDICGNFLKPFTANPLKDIPADQEKGRTYRIVPADNGAANDLDAVINGTTQAAIRFSAVAKEADQFYQTLKNKEKPFFNDNLRAPAFFMQHLNEALLLLAQGYKSGNGAERLNLAKKSLAALHKAEEALHETQHGNFGQWYAGDRIFGFESLYKTLNGVIDKL